MEKFHEVEVFVHVQYRHKIIVETDNEDTAREKAMERLLSEPIEEWCRKESLENWVDNPVMEREEDQFEICNVWDCTSDFK